MITDIFYKEYDQCIWSASKYIELVKPDEMLEKVYSKGRKSLIFIGMTGSGKDTLMMAILNEDVRNKKSVWVIDVKEEYAALIFPQHDEDFLKLIAELGTCPISHNVNLWIPYTENLQEDPDFKKLYKYPHPKLRIRPFRIFNENLMSSDTLAFTMDLTKLQKYSREIQEYLEGMQKEDKYVLIKEIASQRKLIFDKFKNPDQDGWEYIDFFEASKEDAVNVISLRFLHKKSNIGMVGVAIAIVNELFTLALETRQRDYPLAIYFPEFKLFQPDGVKSMEESAKTLLAKMQSIYLVMRSFPVVSRLNQQNLSQLPKGLFSQSGIIAGRTQNTDDMGILKKFNLADSFKDGKDVYTLNTLPIGTFVGVTYPMTNQIIRLVPLAHKLSREEEIGGLLEEWSKDPLKFIYKLNKQTNNGYGWLSDLDMFLDEDVGTHPELYIELIREWQTKAKKTIKQPKKLDLDNAKYYGSKAAQTEDGEEEIDDDYKPR